jgi:hypothetical protein
MADHYDAPEIEAQMVDLSDPGALLDVIVQMLGATDTQTRAAVITGLTVKMAVELDARGMSLDSYLEIMVGHVRQMFPTAQAEFLQNIALRAAMRRSATSGVTH